MRQLLVCSCFLAGLFAIISGSVAADPVVTQQPARPSPVPVEIIQNAEESRHTEAREIKTDQHDSDDLAVQLRQAEAAESQAVASWITVVLGVIGSFFLYLTFRETRRTTVAAIQSSEISQREFLSTHRPRLLIRNIVMEKDEATSLQLNVGVPVQLSFNIVNTGETKGTIIESLSAAVLTASSILPIGENFTAASDEFNDVVLESGEAFGFTYTTSIIPASVNEIIEIDKGLKKIFLSGYFLYTDASEIKRGTGFCRVYDPLTRHFKLVDAPDFEYQD